MAGGRKFARNNSSNQQLPERGPGKVLFTKNKTKKKSNI